jgi:hypothetical protein
MGGLGNQLFQIFTTIAYGIETRKKILFSNSEFLTIGTVRPTYWNTFLSGLSIFVDKESTTSPSLEAFQYQEPGFSYSKIPPLYADERVRLVGYYQSYKYFDNVKDKLFQMIRLRSQQAAATIDYSNYILRDSNNISMHFRLGDYKNIQDCHPLMPYTYYEEALDYIAFQKPQRPLHVLYFCQFEDNEVVSEMIKKLSDKHMDIHFTKVSDDIMDWKQLLLMSCCDDNIIANSTFSWWGAYFNETPEKIVCYPDMWFGPKLQHDVRDLFLDSWVKIPCCSV